MTEEQKTESSSLHPVDQLRAKLANLELEKEKIYKTIESVDSKIARIRRKLDLIAMVGNSSDSEDLISSIIATESVEKPDVCISKDDIPLNMTSPGQVGQMRFDSQFLYVCVDQNTWRRTPLVMWMQK